MYANVPPRNRSWLLVDKENGPHGDLWRPFSGITASVLHKDTEPNAVKKHAERLGEPPPPRGLRLYIKPLPRTWASQSLVAFRTCVPASGSFGALGGWNSGLSSSPPGSRAPSCCSVPVGPWTGTWTPLNLPLNIFHQDAEICRLAVLQGLMSEGPWHSAVGFCCY